jgi:transposase InsO family protein
VAGGYRSEDAVHRTRIAVGERLLRELQGEIVYSIKEIRVLAERWRVHDNTIRPHSSLSYRPPAPEAWITTSLGCGEAVI